jgi:hypothetical protein
MPQFYFSKDSLIMKHVHSLKKIIISFVLLLFAGVQMSIPVFSLIHCGYGMLFGR